MPFDWKIFTLKWEKDRGKKLVGLNSKYRLFWKAMYVTKIFRGRLLWKSRLVVLEKIIKEH